MESKKPPQEFGKRKPVVARPVRPGPPAKRSGHVALLLMGTFAVGTAGYALMPGDHCERPPNVATPSLLQSSAECPPRGSSSSGGGRGGTGSSSRSGFYSGDSSSSHSASDTSSPSAGGVTRGGFGSFAHAFGFSGG
jgi:uncharacterized membrane protein YgcG